MKKVQIDTQLKENAAAAMDEVETALFGKSFSVRTGVAAGAGGGCRPTDPGCIRPLYGVWA